jgi:hypothetical protein
MRPGVAAGVFWKANITWKTGAWARLRTGLSASTSRSKGSAWCSKAPSAVSRTRSTSAAKEGAPSSRVRSASVPAKKPISRSASGVGRFATGVPTTTSSSPDQRPRSAAQAASSTMKGVAPCARASSATRSAVPGGRWKPTDPPRPLGSAGRGRSVGRSSSGGAPASASRHQPSSASSAGPASSRRSARAWAPYVSSSGGSGEGSPRAKAS